MKAFHNALIAIFVAYSGKATLARIRIYIKLSIGLWLLLMGWPAHASHFMGGQITYKCLGDDPGNSANRLYALTLTLYRDCGGCDPFTQPCMGWGDPSDPVPFTEMDVSPPVAGLPFIQMFRQNNSVVDVTLKCRPNMPSKCDDPTALIGVQEWLFTNNISIPKNGGVVTLSHSALARNAVITTILTPGGTSWYIWAEIDPSVCNSSPEFLNHPISIICNNEPFTYNHHAFDAEGDSLVFTLIPCMQDALTEVNYVFPLSGLNPMSTVAGVSVNPVTGEISFEPDMIQIGIMAIRVEEFRNGQEVGEVIRDLQISVQDCSNQEPDVSPLSNGGARDTTIFAGKPFCITFKATDADFNDTSKNLITLSATSGIIPPATWSNPGPARNVNQGDFCWTPECDDVRSQPYIVTVFAQDNACLVPGIDLATFEIYVAYPIATPPPLYCVSVENNNSEIELTWGYPADLDQVEQYLVYRAVNTPVLFNLIDSVNNINITTYTDNDPSLDLENNIYYYYLTSVSPCGDESSPSDTISSILLNSGYVNPSLDMDWNMPYDTYDSIYRVRRKKGPNFVLYDTTGQLLYADVIDTCTPKFLQHFVQSLHPSGCIANSNIVFDTVPGKDLPDPPSLCKAEVNLDNTVTIYFNADTAEADTFEFYRFDPSANDFEKIGFSTDRVDLSFRDSTVNASQAAFTYTMSVIDTCNNYSEIQDTSHTTIELSATAGQLSVDLDWTPYVGWFPPPDKYVIYRGRSFPLDSIGETTDTVFQDTALSCNVRYFYRVQVRRSGGGFCDTVWSDTASAVPVDNVLPQTPEFCVVTVADNYVDVIVKFFSSTSGDNDSTFIWDLSHPVPEQLIDVKPDTNGLITLLLPGFGYGCFELDAIDTCGNFSLRSDVVCTIDLSASGDDRQNNLTWTPYVGWIPDYYVVYRLDGSGAPDSIGQTTATEYIDSLIPSVCDSTYTYRIKAVNAAAPCPESFSDTAKATPYDGKIPDFPVFCNINVESNHRDVFIEFEKSGEGDVIGYELYRSPDDVLVAQFDKDSTRYLDAGIITEGDEQHCYYLVANDSCGNTSEHSPVYCNIDLEAYADIRSNVLEWNSYTIWQPDEYIIYGGHEFPLEILGTTNDTTFLHDEISCEQEFIYQVEAVRNLSGKCISSFSDTAIVRCSDFMFPNVFTPNGDGANDQFQPIIGTNIISIDIEIYNRWGGLVFKTNDADRMWDGLEMNGQPVTVGVYYHVSKVGLLANRKEHLFHFTGWVKVIRED